ncbi:hypothetical protein D6C98_09504 [Aureobasidium pullulans]|nr:hypothetical protein D6C98_09504 [Aureobasidium pullulans]
MSPPASSSPTPNPLPPFDESTYDPLTFDTSSVPKEIRMKWCHDPIVYLAGNVPDKRKAKTAKEYIRRRHPRCLRWVQILFLVCANAVISRSWEKSTGKYKKFLPWFGVSAILAHVTPDELERKGCININTTNPLFISRRFRLKANHMANANKDRSAIKLHGDHNGIHPCFRRGNWVETSDFEYELMKPILRVASKMLEMPSLLDIWHALGSPLHHKPGTKMMPKGSYVYYTGRSSEDERTKTSAEMERLANYVTFRWEDTGGMFACTSVDEKKIGLRGTKGTTETRNARYACIVSIDTNVRYILSGGTGYAASRYNPAAQDESSLLRVRYHAAMSLIHEMTHVWFLNTLAIDEDIFPFANDQRIGEEGYACEAVITKGVTIGPISANSSVDTMPFGMMAAPWPGVQKHDDWDKFVSASRAKQGINRNVQYAVPMKFIRDFFTDELWDNREKRFGAGALEGYKAIAVRQKCNFYPGDFNSFESPTVEKVRDEDTGLNIDTWMPDVEEGKRRCHVGCPRRNRASEGCANSPPGIIYSDRAFELSGAPIDITM